MLIFSLTVVTIAYIGACWLWPIGNGGLHDNWIDYLQRVLIQHVIVFFPLSFIVSVVYLIYYCIKHFM